MYCNLPKRVAGSRKETDHLTLTLKVLNALTFTENEADASEIKGKKGVQVVED